MLPNLPGSTGLHYCWSVDVSTSCFAEILELGDHVFYHHLYRISLLPIETNPPHSVLRSDGRLQA